jgi:hypothetical protein
MTKDLDTSSWSDAELETLAASEFTDPAGRGAARAELVKRQRRYELDRDENKRLHDMRLFEAQGNRAAIEQEFQENLATRQEAQADKIAQAQLLPARTSARATMWATVAAGLSAFAALGTVAVGYFAYIDQRDQHRAAAAPLFDFYTEDSLDQPTVGIEIENDGASPLAVSKVVYFVDGKRVTGAFEERAHLDPDKIQSVEFFPHDHLAVGQHTWIYSRSTTDKAQLPEFAKYIDDHVAVGVRACSQVAPSECVSRCSTPGMCDAEFKD